MDIKTLLDEAKTSGGFRTDEELAKKLGVTRNSVSNYRSGYSLPKAAVCERIAKITGKNPLSVIAIVEEARAISSEDKAVWRRLASAAAIGLIALSGLTNSPTNGQGESGRFSHNNGTLHIMFNRLRRLWARPSLSGHTEWRSPAWT